jgi:hypothetical protein
MIFNKPSSAELKSMLEKKISEIKSSEERVEILNEIKKLWESRDIDVYYKGGIMDFKNFVEYRIQEEDTGNNINVNWSNLFEDLYGKYIRDATLHDFSEVMIYKRLPNSKKKRKILWLGSKADAVRFLDNFNFTIPEFNDSFVQKDGKKIDPHDRSKTNPKTGFSKLLVKHKQQ